LKTGAARARGTLYFKFLQRRASCAMLAKAHTTNEEEKS
jgi:hypothetical protein